jgi:hypothetical protein
VTSALSEKERALIDRYWRAANYLSVGQIYLYDNPLLKRPLTKEHIKPRLLGHWGTTPGLNFIYVHLNRLIKKHDLDMIYITGPGHGGPGLVANAYLEGTYSEVYPNIASDAEGMGDDGTLSFRPRRAPQENAILRFPLMYRGQMLEIEIGQENVEYSLRQGDTLTIRHEKEEIRLTKEHPAAARPVSRR